MTKIDYPALKSMAEHYELVLDAAQEYRGFLINRLEEYKMRDTPPDGIEIVGRNIDRVDRFIELMEGELFDVLRSAVDGIGVLEAVDQGIWV